MNYTHTPVQVHLCVSPEILKASSVLTTVLFLLSQATCLATTPYWTRSPFTPPRQSEQYQDHPVSQVGEVPQDPRVSRAPLAGPVFLVPMARAEDQGREVREGGRLLIY